MRKNILKAIALLAIPFTMAGLSSGDTYADASTIPEGQPFTDINFFNCVVNRIGADNVAETGPTTEQLESITSLSCLGYNKPDTKKIKDASSLEKMTALKELYLDSNQLTSIDVSHNTALESFYGDDIFVKTAITSSDATGPKQYDLNTLKFFESVIPEGNGYAYNGESKILTVQNPLSTNYIQVDNRQNADYQKYKLVLHEESTPAPGTDAEDEGIVVPNTGAMNQSEGGALAIFTATTFIILSAIAMAGVHKKHSSGHFKYDK